METRASRKAALNRPLATIPSEVNLTSFSPTSTITARSRANHAILTKSRAKSAATESIGDTIHSVSNATASPSTSTHKFVPVSVKIEPMSSSSDSKLPLFSNQPNDKPSVRGPPPKLIKLEVNETSPSSTAVATLRSTGIDTIARFPTIPSVANNSAPNVLSNANITSSTSSVITAFERNGIISQDSNSLSPGTSVPNHNAITFFSSAPTGMRLFNTNASSKSAPRVPSILPMGPRFVFVPSSTILTNQTATFNSSSPSRVVATSVDNQATGPNSRPTSRNIFLRGNQTLTSGTQNGPMRSNLVAQSCARVLHLNQQVMPTSDINKVKDTLIRNKFDSWLRQNQIKQEGLDRTLKCMINQMPNEILMIIFNNLPLRDLIRHGIVCHHWMNILSGMLQKVTKLTLFSSDFPWVHTDFYQLQFFPPINLSPQFRKGDTALECPRLSWETVKYLEKALPSVTELCLYNVVVLDKQMFQLFRSFRLAKFVFAPANSKKPFCWYNFWCHFQNTQSETIQTIAVLNARTPLLNISGNLPQLRALCVDLISTTGRMPLVDLFNQLKNAKCLESLCFRNVPLAAFMAGLRQLLKDNPKLDGHLQETVRHFTWQGDADKAISRIHIPALTYLEKCFPNLTHLDMNLCFDIEFGYLVSKLKSLERLAELRLTSGNTGPERKGFFSMRRYSVRNSPVVVDQMSSLRWLCLNTHTEPAIYFYELVLSKVFPNLVELHFQNVGRVYIPCRCKPRLKYDFDNLKIGESYECLHCPMYLAVAFVAHFKHLRYVYRNSKVVFDRMQHRLGNLKEFRRCLELYGQSTWTPAR